MSTSYPHQHARSEAGRKLVLSASALVSVCYLGAIAGLWQWGADAWWTRFDRYSVSILILSGVLVAQHIRFYHRLPSGGEVAGEAFGASYDPSMGLWNGILMLAEIGAVIDYGQWQLTPWLEQDGLQTIGLLVFGFALVLVVWADKYLLRHFSLAPDEREVITRGPFRWVRHPRYLGLFLSRVGFALVFASILAWILIPLWAIVVLRRIRIEEAHLKTVFGSSYREYTQRTRRRPLFK